MNHQRLRGIALAGLLLAGCGSPEGVRESTPAPEPTEGQVLLAEQRLARDARREDLERRAAREPGWALFESEHYFLMTDVDDPAFVRAALRRLEAVRARLARELPPRAPGVGIVPASPVLVRICSKVSGYHDYGGPAGSSSYYHPDQGEMVLFDDLAGGGRGNTWSSLQHIAVHEYLAEAIGFGTVTPPWLLYGTATVYAGMVLVDGELRIDHFDRKFLELAQVVSEGPRLPLASLLSFDRAEFYGSNELRRSARQNLILAWSFAYYLRIGRSEDPRWQEAWTGLAPRFVAGWQESGTLEGARQAALAGVDLEALDAAWWAWVGRSASD